MKSLLEYLYSSTDRYANEWDGVTRVEQIEDEQVVVPKKYERLKELTYDNLDQSCQEQSIWNIYKEGGIKLDKSGLKLKSTRTDYNLILTGPQITDKTKREINIVSFDGMSKTGRTSRYPQVRIHDTNISDLTGIFNNSCDFSGIVEINISNCPNLKSLKGLPVAGKGNYEVYLYDCDGLTSLDGINQRVSKLGIWGCRNLKDFSGLPNNLKGTEIEIYRSSIQSLNGLPKRVSSIQWDAGDKFRPTYDEIVDATKAYDPIYGYKIGYVSWKKGYKSEAYEYNSRTEPYWLDYDCLV